MNLSLNQQFKAIIILILIFLSSYTIYYVVQPEFQFRVFFYEMYFKNAISSEARAVPSRKNQEDQIKVFLNELLIGPADLSLAPIVPNRTHIDHVAVVGKIVYVNIDQSILDNINKLTNNFDIIYNLIKKNIEFNFPNIEEVVININGHQYGTRSVFNFP